MCKAKEEKCVIYGDRLQNCVGIYKERVEEFCSKNFPDMNDEKQWTLNTTESSRLLDVGSVYCVLCCMKNFVDDDVLVGKIGHVICVMSQLRFFLSAENILLDWDDVHGYMYLCSDSSWHEMMLGPYKKMLGERKETEKCLM